MSWEIKMDHGGRDFTVIQTESQSSRRNAWEAFRNEARRVVAEQSHIYAADPVLPWAARAPREHADDQTAKHLTALDAALEEAMKAVKRDNRWEAKRSNQGGYYVGAGMIYLHAFDQAFIEAIAAFFAGDLLTALQRREEVNNSLPVVP